MNRIGTIALVVSSEEDSTWKMVESLSDEREIAVLEAAIHQGDRTPLEKVHQYRERNATEDEAFGDYVEALLSKPCVRPEIQEHGVKWLRSKIRIEEFQRSEREATCVIADYAFRLFLENPQKREFCLSGPTARVKIRIYPLREDPISTSRGSQIA